MKIPFRRTRVPVLVLHGVIARRGAIHLGAYERPIARAAALAKRCGHLVLDIDSPGGSPVQSDLVAGALRRAAEKDGFRIHAAIADVGASGGYWIACAADRILANPMSIVGSIGVIGGGFGFPAAIARLGIERRVYKAGANKQRLDPFLPERAEDVAFTEALMTDIHKGFIAWVRQRRGAALREAALKEGESLFDGGYMLGTRAVEVGLTDGIGDVAALVRELGGEKARAVRIGPKRKGLLSRVPGLALDALAERTTEARFPTLG
jgi:ClpP class serine protease